MNFAPDEGLNRSLSCCRTVRRPDRSEPSFYDGQGQDCHDDGHGQGQGVVLFLVGHVRRTTPLRLETEDGREVSLLTQQRCLVITFLAYRSYVATFDVSLQRPHCGKF